MSKVIQATRKGETYDVIVDDDFECKNKLRIMNAGYAVSYFDGEIKLLHRVIIGAKKGEVVDHINRNKLDNRLENLRIVTRAQNNVNKINKGYSFHKNSGLWFSFISRRGMKNRVKYFKTKEEARADYKIRHAKEFGEYSPYYKELTNNDESK